MKSRILMGVALVLPMLFQSGAALGTITQKTKLTVVALTDFHGALESDFISVRQSANAKAAGKAVEKVEAGGAALLSTYVDILRRKAPGPVIVVDAGDMFQGTMASNLAEGAPVVRFYNYLGVAAAALGNHEFDYGPVGEKSIPRSELDDPQGALRERIREAGYPILAVNVFDEKGERPSWIKASTIVVTQGVRVGIVGASTEETPSTTTAANLKGLVFAEPTKHIEREAQRLRDEEKVDAVVLTFHEGGGCKNNTNQDDLSSCDEGKIFKIVRDLPQGLIDVVVAGHTHKGIAKRIGNTVILQSYSRGKQIGWAEVPIGYNNRRPRVAGFEPICGTVVKTTRGRLGCDLDAIKNAPEDAPVYPASFLGEVVEPNEEVVNLLKPDFERVAQLKNTPVGIEAVDYIEPSYGAESAMGNLIADLCLEAMGADADIGMTNGGGVRAKIAPGSLNYGNIFDVLPFDNRLALLKISGETLWKMVELGHSGGHGALTWSGLNFVADGCDVKEVSVNGQALDRTKLYRVITNDYLAGGGSGFSGLGMASTDVDVLMDNAYIMRDVVFKMLKKRAKNLVSKDYFDPANPRQKITGTCEQH